MFWHHTVTRVRPGLGRDRYNNPVPDWEHATRTTISGVNIQPRSQAETTTSTRNLVATGWTLYTAPGVDLDLDAGDRVEWGGLLLEVEGEAARWYDPVTGGVHHVEVALRRVTG